MTRLRSADNRRVAANRAGFSIRCSVRIASPNDTSTIANRPASPSAAPKSAGASSSTGQCHRYQRVRQPADRPHRRLRQQAPKPGRCRRNRRRCTSAVPSTGSSAAEPGTASSRRTAQRRPGSAQPAPADQRRATAADSRRHAPRGDSATSAADAELPRPGRQREVRPGRPSVGPASEITNDPAASTREHEQHGGTDAPRRAAAAARASSQPAEDQQPARAGRTAPPRPATSSAAAARRPRRRRGSRCLARRSGSWRRKRGGDARRRRPALHSQRRQQQRRRRRGGDEHQQAAAGSSRRMRARVEARPAGPCRCALASRRAAR